MTNEKGYLFRVKVDDSGGYVELQDFMGSDFDIVSAARASYLGHTKGAEKDKKLLFYLMRNRHTSPFEMAEFRFRIKAPLVVWWQILRHRTASVNMQSGRYTEFPENDFYVPSQWRLQSKSNKQGSEGVLEGEIANVLTNELIEHYNRSYALYQKALDNGVAREMARLFLPGFAVYYTGIWKIDAHNLMHFLELRLAEEAQWETRQYAIVIYDMFKKILYWTSEAFETYRIGKSDG